MPKTVRFLRRVADALEGPPNPYTTEARFTTPRTPDVSLFVRQLPIDSPDETSGVVRGRWRAAHQARTPRERQQDAASATEVLPVLGEPSEATRLPWWPLG